jgi:hypothetical protein
MGGIIIDHLKRCDINEKIIDQCEQQFIKELTKWASYDPFFKIAYSFANIIQLATHQQVYVDIKRR